VSNSGTVVTYDEADARHPDGHEAITRTKLAAGIAALKRCEFGGEYDSRARYAPPVYFVPSRTVVGVERAARLNIRSEEDVFGGVVPMDFVATKSITHPLIENGSAPEGWAAEFATTVEPCVLRGFTAFTRDDAHRAGEQLLQHGPVRIKRSQGIGGGGQWLIENLHELSERLHSIEDCEITSTGVVIEEHLENVTTYSVGRVRAAGVTCSYWGTQRLTRNNHGAEVYGGTDLRFVRGGFDALDEFALSSDVRCAIAQARAYDTAASTCFPGFFASRRNYDVARGVDNDGTVRSGVLEQSWRAGGASGAEIAAIGLLQRNATLRAIRASTTELYGDAVEPPPEATIYFRGVDPHIGTLTKFAIAQPHDDAR
jgi:hypothetical protein